MKILGRTAISAVAIVGTAFMSFPLTAGPGYNLNFGYQLHAADTACPKGKPILNVNRKVINAVDSGTGKNDSGYVWWATSSYNQQIVVIETDPNVFCATVKSEGHFESVGGDGPGCATEGNCETPEGRLEAGVTGTFQGGWTNTFTGNFVPGGKPTKGNIGTLDADCDANTPAGCPASVFSRYLSEYFSGVAGFALPWWGWVYHAGNNGSWVNSSVANEGNIKGN